MKIICFLLSFLPTICFCQKEVRIRIPYQFCDSNFSTIEVDSVQIEQGFGQGPALKFNLLIFDEDCDIIDSMELGEHNPYNQNFISYHYRQIEEYDMKQLDSTLKYRIPDGTNYFLSTPCQYRPDFVASAYAPLLNTLDSIWGQPVADATTAMILFHRKGNPAMIDTRIAVTGEDVIGLIKTICHDLKIEEESSFSPEVFPNPTSEIVNIKFRDVTHSKIQILDGSGKVVFEKSITGQETSINVSGLEQGYYNLRVVSDNDVYCQNLIIN